MVKYLLILLCSAQLALGQSWFGAMLTAQHPVSAVCATTDTSLPHDTFLEGFQGTGYESGVTIFESGIPNEDADTTSLTSGKPSGACSEAAYYDVSGAEVYTRWDLGANADLTGGMDFYCYLYIQAQPDNTEAIRIAVLGSTTSSSTAYICQLNIVGTTGNPSLSVIGSVNSSTVSVAMNTWHKVKIHLDATASAGGSHMEVNDNGSPVTFTRFNNNLRYIFAGGVTSVGATDNVQVYFDLLTLDIP